MRMISLAILVVLAGNAAGAEPGKPSAQSIEYFEAKVRPLLAEHCYSCHGPKKQNAGLRLDTATGMKQGADSGPVVLPGDPLKSVLMRSVRREGDAPMPPNKPLPPEAVSVLTEWVKTGASFPDDQAVKPVGPDSRKHWAFQPIRDSQPPVLKDGGRAGNAVDCFVLAKLEEKGLAYAAPADRRTLIRRVTIDLTGLPPTPAEIAAFETDKASNAFAKVVDRLLASPQYGERWGRYWLDIARYADTKGYVFNEDRNYPYAYTYRDYVIRSFNDDKPYDRFLLEQLAADKLDLGNDKQALAAMGFLTVGRRFLNDIHDVTDDRIDTVSRGLMGLTVACARCHDHKYDPIPAKDYYSLYGVFRSSVEPKELPLIGEAKKSPESDAFKAEHAKQKEALANLIKTRHAEAIAKLRTPDSATAYMLAVFENRGKPPLNLPGYLTTRDLNQLIFNRWRTFITEELKAKPSIFAPLAALAALPENAFPAQAEAALAKLAKDPKAADPGVVKALIAVRPQTLKDTAVVYGKLFADSSKGGAVTLANVFGADGPTDVPIADFDKFRNRADRDAISVATAKLDKFVAGSPYAPPRAMVMQDGDPFQPYVFLRGSQNNHGPTVPRQFLEIVAGPNRKPFVDGSGRLEMAKAVINPENPLTARVWVNRIWALHFGQGLVRTPSDFGVRTEAPSHPELLDWLAKRLIESGWSTKNLHRMMLLSNAYQQGSNATPTSAAPNSDLRTPHSIDPENRLLSHQNRRRLDFESLRDSMLFVAGQLDPAMGGKPVDVFKAPLPKRRSVYAFIDRQNVPGTFRAFDVASSDQHSPQRYQTTVPQQALFLMNSPFVTEQAKAFAARPDVQSAKMPDERIERMYRTALGRPPRTEEREAAREFVSGAASANLPFGVWEQFAQVLLLSNEFAFAD